MDQDGNEAWTARRVEDRLIAAFRALPTSPVFGGGRLGFCAAGGGPSDHSEALSWCPRFVDSKPDSLALLTWARCRAMGESVRERYAALGWKRASAERQRQRALARIVDRLRDEAGA